MTRLILAIFILFFISVPIKLNAQISYGGVPASFTGLKNARISVPVIEMERVSNYELLMSERNDKRVMKPFRFAKTFNVDVNPTESGLWTEADDGTRIWRVGIKSPGAYSLNIIFDRFHLPDGAQLFIYSPDRERLLGAFNVNNERPSGTFAVRPIPGDEIIVEYNEPSDADFNGELHIAEVNHDYKNIFGDRPLGESGLCNIDVYCVQGENFQKEKQAVVRLLIGNVLCTGTLVNNTSEDLTPYLITAGHCIEMAGDADQTIFYFNYESPDCGQNKGSLDGYVDQTISGSILRARSDSLDFALVELGDIPPPEYRPYFAGWDRSGNIPSSTSCIHHPMGDVKKIAIDNDSPSEGSFNDSYIPDAFWWIREWDEGTTEVGSSGSSLFNVNGEIIGTLTGGEASCSNSVNDFFAMLNKQWDYFSSPDRQLKAWLDPGNTGISSIEAIDPYSDEELVCDLFSNSVPGEKYLLNRLSDGGYITGKNSQMAESYAERFSLNGRGVIDALSFGVGKLVTQQGSNVVFKVYEADKFTGYPGFELASKSVPLNQLYEGSMFYVQLDSPVEVTGDYFIGYNIDYSQTADTFAVYHSPARAFSSDNSAFVKISGEWRMFNNLPQYDINTSLLIKSHACAQIGIEPPDTIISDSRYQVLYPQSGISNYVYLRDTKEEGWADVSIIDISGRTLIEEERYLSKDPIIVSVGNHLSGIYFIRILSDNAREVKKVKMKTGR